MAENLITNKETPVRDESDIAIKISGLKKRYKLGLITAGTLKGDLQSWWARKRGKEDPNLKIGAKRHNKNEVFMALDGIDLTIYKGERIGIIGHNGAGKSTLLKLLARVTGPTEGEIKIDGRITSMLEVGTGFNGELTGRENIYLNGAILGMTKAEVDKKIEQIIEFSECRQFIDTPVKRYSSGMFVKLAFSVAAHLDSEIMIMDEVLAVGDMAFQRKCLEKMSDVSKTEGRTILYVSHNMNTIRQLCDRCVVLNHGKIIFNGDVEEAIGIYLKDHEDASLETHYNYNEYQRKFDPREAKIIQLEISDKKIAKFVQGERINFLLHFKALKDYGEISFRFQIYLDNGNLIGSTFLNETLEITKGNNYKLNFSFDTKNLIPGKYFADVIVFAHDGRGNAKASDAISKGLSFEITNQNDSLVWWRNPFGFVKFDDLNCEDFCMLNDAEKNDA